MLVKFDHGYITSNVSNFSWFGVIYYIITISSNYCNHVTVLSLIKVNKNYCVFIIPTYTDGTPADGGKWFYTWLKEAATDFRYGASYLQGLQYCVVGLGNSLYGSNFCKVGLDNSMELAFVR